MRPVFQFMCAAVFVISAVRGDANCGNHNVLSANNGEIVSHAGFDKGHNYGKNLNCLWTIQAPSGQHVELVALNFSLSYSSTCSSDYVELFDSNTPDPFKSLGKFCGTHFSPITSTGQTLTVLFHTNSYGTHEGFKFRYNFTSAVIHSNCTGFQCDNGGCIRSRYKCDGDDDCADDSDEQGCPACPSTRFECTNHKCVYNSFVCDGDDDCGDGSDELQANCHHNFHYKNNSACGNLNFTGSSGVIQSPNYPQHYPNNIYCRYQIFAPATTQKITIEFDDRFGFEASTFSSRCYDYVSLHVWGHLHRYGPYCGSNPPAQFDITGSGSNHLVVEFSSDLVNSYTGFKMTWTAV